MLSIIIPVFNQFNYTKQIVLDLQKQLPYDVEVVIVNNGSTDNTYDFLSSLGNPFTIVNSNQNEGFAKACNKGYSKSTGDTVCFLNNDVRLGKDNFFEAVVSAVNKNSNCLLGPTGGFVDSNYSFMYETEGSLPINYISGWCIFADRLVFEKLANDLNNKCGPFWEGNLAYFEDTYMGFQCKKLGIGLKLSKVPAKHIGRVTSKILDMRSLYVSAKINFITTMQRGI